MRLAVVARARRILVVVAFALAALGPLFGLARAAHAYTPPPLEGPVTDPAQRLTLADKAAIAKKLVDYKARTGREITVFVAPSLNGEDVRDVTYGTARTWKLGTKGVDDGVLLLVAPVERKIHIETAKGVGGALTDVESARIAREIIGPRLKVDDFRGALDEGTTAIMTALDRDPSLPRPEKKPAAAKSVGDVVAVVLVLGLVFGLPGLILFLAIRAARRGGGGGGGGGTGTGGGGFWIGGFGGGGGDSGGSSWGGGDSGGSSGGSDWGGGGGGGGDWGGGGGGSDY